MVRENSPWKWALWSKRYGENVITAYKILTMMYHTYFRPLTEVVSSLRLGPKWIGLDQGQGPILSLQRIVLLTFRGIRKIEKSYS